MKKITVLLLGALIAMVALQGCSKDEATAPDQAVDQTTTDTPSQPDPWAPVDGKIPIAKFELALGGASADEPVSNVVHSPSYGVGTDPTGEFGLGVLDVTVSGQGRVGTTSACPNSLDPITGLPLAVDPCAGNRGTVIAGSAIESTLTVNNITGGAGSLGTCALFPANSICTVDADCSPRSATEAFKYCLGSLVTGSTATAGFCRDGSTACASATTDDDGQSSACGAGTCSITVTERCAVNADCPGLETCVGATPIGGLTPDAKCHTGCGACVPGRQLNCVGIQVTGGQPMGTPGDLDALGNIKCSGGPYNATQAGVNGADANSPGGAYPGPLDTWMVGNPGINQGGSASGTISIDSFNDSFCIHYFTVLEDPRGDAPFASCRTQCGDGFIAAANLTPEVCEPVYASGQTIGANKFHHGCGVSGGAPVAPCTDTANCVCNSCGACMDELVLCGNGVLDAGETCDPGLPLADNCCNPATCQLVAAGAVDPQGICVVAGDPACNIATCDAVGACQDTPQAGACGSAVDTACDNPDSCAAGVCVANYEAGGTSCSADSCNPDTCDGAGVCTDNAILPDNTTPCTVVPANPALDTCCGGVCVDAVVPGTCPVACTIATRATRGRGVSGTLNGVTETLGGLGDTINPGPATYRGEHRPAVDYFMSIGNEAGLLNEAGAAVMDKVFFDVQQVAGCVDGGLPTCTIGGVAATVIPNIATGDPDDYIVFGDGPDLGIRALAQQDGVGVDTWPSFAAATAPTTLACTANTSGTPMANLAISVSIANHGAVDVTNVATAGGSTFKLQTMGYCNPVDGCDSGGLGGSGWQVANYGLFFDTTLFSAAGAGYAILSNNQSRAPEGTQYAMLSSCKVPSAAVNTSMLGVGHVQVQGDSNMITPTCRLWDMANLHTVRITTRAAAVPANTVTDIQISAWSAFFTLATFTQGGNALDVTADGGVTWTVPATDASATIVWQ